jgi:hypothetical protein
MRIPHIVIVSAMLLVFSACGTPDTASSPQQESQATIPPAVPSPAAAPEENAEATLPPADDNSADPMIESTPSPAPELTAALPAQVELAAPTITPPAARSGPASEQSGPPATVGPITGTVVLPSRIALVPPGPASESGPVPADLLNRIVDNLSATAGVDRAAVQVVESEAALWNDGSLGCPKPGATYTQETNEGYRVVLEAGGVRYDYRITIRGQLLRCK